MSGLGGDPACWAHLFDDGDDGGIDGLPDGALTVDLGRTCRDLAADHLVLIPRGVRRSITAGPSGITYLSVHRRRGPLGIGPLTGHATRQL